MLYYGLLTGHNTHDSESLWQNTTRDLAQNIGPFSNRLVLTGNVVIICIYYSCLYFFISKCVYIYLDCQYNAMYDIKYKGSEVFGES